LRERFDQLLNGRGDTARQERGRSAGTGKPDDADKAEAAPEDDTGKAEPALFGHGALHLRDIASGRGREETALALPGMAGAIQPAGITAAAEVAQAAPRGADPAMLQLAEHIASLHLPSSGTWQVELPGSERIAARVERAMQGGGYAIALHLPARAVEHRRRLAAELAMHLDARGLPRCTVRLEDDPPAG